MPAALATAEMTVALALAAGVIAQSLARHLRIPGIVVLLAVGVLLGPDGLSVIEPDLLGDALLTLVGFAVAVILFEGGLNLRIERLRRENRAIRQLVTLGALVTLVGGSLAARVIMGWEWTRSILFGTLVIVTGPTVITPLLRRLRVEHKTATVLEAEGVLIDAVGAVVATVALEVALSPTGKTFALGLLHVPASLAAGTAMGLLGGLLLALLLRFRNVIPEGLENIFTLSLVLALFQVANAAMAESGIAAATVAGIVVGNSRSHVQRELMEFKEQLTVMFIGMLFVLLAADVRLSEVQALGGRGVLTALLLMLVVRPLNVLVGTYRTELSTRQKTFLAAIGPRGIVAAAIAAFFAAELEAASIAGGGELRALVFLVIVVTVLTASLAGPLLARALGLRRPQDRGWLVLGSNELAVALGRALDSGTEDVVCIDTNASACEAAEQAGLRAVVGNGLREDVLAEAEIDTRRGAIALSPNTEVNLLFMQRAREQARRLQLLVAIGRARAPTAQKLVYQAGGHLLFGRPEQVDLWAIRLRRGIAEVQRWQLTRQARDDDGGELLLADAHDGLLLALAYHRGSTAAPVDDGTRFKRGDEVSLLINLECEDEAKQWLTDHGFERQNGRDDDSHPG
ncbi:MAG: cation:proton antiporter [Myxococcales bacterium]|nr:cation:proton antiporter [Myxococcales bacterium]